MELWLQAARNEKAREQIKLGICFLDGKELLVELKEIMQWLEKSAAEGNRNAEEVYSWLKSQIDL